MDNTIFFLVGHAGVGKLTTAKAISGLTGARVIDNHYANNPIFNLIELYRKEPLPDAVWERIGEVRRAVHETIATLSPPAWSFVFTLVALEEHEPDRTTYHSIRDVARRRGARFQPVHLKCAPQEHERRIVSPERRLLLKDMSPAYVSQEAARPLLQFEEPHALHIDTTALPAEEVARQIVTAASTLR
jgi:predicted kinase